MFRSSLIWLIGYLAGAILFTAYTLSIYAAFIQQYLDIRYSFSIELAMVIAFLCQHPDITGVVNCAAPNPVPNVELMRRLREVMHIPIGLPAPRWLLKAGALMIGTETELVLKSRWVLPERLQQEGFTFAFPHLKGALTQIVTKK